MLELGYEDVFQSDLKVPAYVRIGKWWIDTLKPEIFSTSTGSGQRKAPHHTAYLDGLRGFAAFMVYWHHHQLWPRALGDLIFENAFGFEERYYFACIPGIRTFFSGGHFAVALFFVSKFSQFHQVS
jgi:hypothetical protein